MKRFSQAIAPGAGEETSAFFSARTLAVVTLTALVLLALSVLSRAYDFPSPVRGRAQAPGEGTMNVSAIGYAGFYDTLKRLGRPVRRALSSPTAQAGPDGTVIVIAPARGGLDGPEFQKTLERAPRLLLVLPKWRGRPDPANPDWVGSVERIPLPQAQRALEAALPEGRAARRNWPETWTTNEIGLNPVGRDMIQVVRSASLRPIVGRDNGDILLGELTRDGRTIWVLADPDLMANHGLHLDRNAQFMVRVLDQLQSRHHPRPGGPLVFDETVHGQTPPEGSPWRLLFRFPFVLFTLLGVLAAVFVAAAGGGRFGPPRRPAPVWGFGKAGLIDNAARLLDYSGHQAVTLKRYARLTLTQTARALHAPRGLSDLALAAWLDRIGQARGIKRRCETLVRELGEFSENRADGLSNDLPRLLALAREFYLWKGEILQ